MFTGQVHTLRIFLPSVSFFLPSATNCRKVTTNCAGFEVSCRVLLGCGSDWDTHVSEHLQVSPWTQKTTARMNNCNNTRDFLLWQIRWNICSPVQSNEMSPAMKPIPLLHAFAIKLLPSRMDYSYAGEPYKFLRFTNRADQDRIHVCI
jgi:hypothetical protein